jgi:hypothetical protein
MLWSAIMLMFAAAGWRDVIAESRFLLSAPVEARRSQ